MAWTSQVTRRVRAVPAGQPYKRRILIIKPRFQLKFMLQLGAFSLLGVVLSMALVLGYALVRTGSSLSTQFMYRESLTGPLGFTSLLGILFWPMMASALIGAAVSLYAGLVLSHRIAGPLYRFEKVMRDLRTGQWPDRVRLRAGDEFQEVAEEMDRTVAWLRGRVEGRASTRGRR
jgi:methyl-accepting chemotaxis protein